VKAAIGTYGVMSYSMVGLALGWSRHFSSFLFGVEATDLATYVSVPVVLFGVAFMACMIPA